MQPKRSIKPKEPFPNSASHIATNAASVVEAAFILFQEGPGTGFYIFKHTRAYFLLHQLKFPQNLILLNIFLNFCGFMNIFLRLALYILLFFLRLLQINAGKQGFVPYVQGLQFSENK